MSNWLMPFVTRSSRPAFRQPSCSTARTEGGLSSTAGPRAIAGQANALLSIHHDSVQRRYLSQWTTPDGRPMHYSDKFRGYSLFVSKRNGFYSQSLGLAQLIGAELAGRALKFTMHHAEDIPGERRQLVDTQVGVYRYDELFILKSARMPAVLFEAGVIVNRDEETQLASPQRRALVGEAIASAMSKFCGSASAH
jgi:N-acetylmuramoyl-L-alanine amidase